MRLKNFYLMVAAILFSATMLNAQNVNVTFQVDMSLESNVDTVTVAGSFQGAVIDSMWSDWTPGISILTDGDNDGVYTMTVAMPVGSYEFKYLNGTAWGTDEGVPGACATNGNRGLDLTGFSGTDTTLEAICFGTCAPCPTTVDTVEVTISVDMTNQIIIDPASVDVVSVAGSFQGAVLDSGWSDWTPGATVLRDPDGDSVYSTTFRIPEGTYQYKFINGTAWGFDEGVPAACAVSGNREMILDGTAGQQIAVGPFCFEECGTTCSQLLPAINVTFRVDLSEVGPADSVYVAGNWQEPAAWQKNVDRMTDDDGDFVYEFTASIRPGEYEYKFINGYDPDPNASALEEVLDSIATQSCVIQAFSVNRLLDIAGVTQDTILPAYYYGRCAFSSDGSTVGIEDDLNATRPVRAYPNPFSASVTVEFSNDLRLAYDIELVSIDGKVVRSVQNFTGDRLTIDRGNLANGLYFLSLRNAKGERYTQKLVIQ